ncbi:MAG: CatB-related O-acetyltransferase [Selenomonadaceae bacterium]|nr:CatB-related O-acetyltransferase [Selenomonadaceae bacterium]
MAYKALVFGVDDLFESLKPYYVKAAEQGILEIVAAAVFENGEIRFVTDEVDRGVDNSINFDVAIISSRNDFYKRMKFLEAQGVPRNRIIDGRVFQVPNLDFPRLLNEGVAYGVFKNSQSFAASTYTIYPQVYGFKNNATVFSLDKKSYIRGGIITEGQGIISVEKFSSLAPEIYFNVRQNYSHNYRNVGTFPVNSIDWHFPKEFYPPQGACKILIGNDVWIGRGCILKCTNPNKPLVIGDGAVIASNSVVVKNIPPYAIVRGNPAQIIKFRFSEDVIKSLLKIKVGLEP